MRGFLSEHGTNPNIFSGDFLDFNSYLPLDVTSDEQRESTNWVDVEELPAGSYSYIDCNFEDRIIAAIDGDDEPVIDHDVNSQANALDKASVESDEGGYYPILETSVEEDVQHDLLTTPSFQGRNNNHRRVLAEHLNRKQRRSDSIRGKEQVWAKWRDEDGKRPRKDARRWSRRHQEMNNFDFWYLEHRGHEIDSFIVFEEANYSDYFEPVNDLNREGWERHLFLVRYENYDGWYSSNPDYGQYGYYGNPYEESFYDYYDDLSQEDPDPFYGYDFADGWDEIDDEGVWETGGTDIDNFFPQYGGIRGSNRGYYATGR